MLWNGVLLKDNKIISDIHSYRAPFALPQRLNIYKLDADSIYPLNSLQTFELLPMGVSPAQLDEWQKFLIFLKKYRKVALLTVSGWELLINPPFGDSILPNQKLIVSYRLQNVSVPQQKPFLNLNADLIRETKGKGSSHQRRNHPEKNDMPKYAKTHPSYLETLGQNHASWMFGALAELIDNARDAKATRIDITIEEEYFKAANARVPVLYVRDNGTGMNHTDILHMVSFGHKRPENDDKSLIGRFGVGFKTGTMRLGKDAVVFTQTEDTCNIAFLSRSYNDGREEVEIPVIAYHREGNYMEFDFHINSQEEAKARLKVLKQFSPFNEYKIGAIFAAFGEASGTTVCVYNLEKWGSDYALQWDPKVKIDETKSRLDITIRSRRVRMRPSQMTKQVPLDYSLHAYLEVTFLEPKMKFYIQGTLVKTRRLHKSLNRTQVFKDTLLGGKQVELTIGRVQAEKDRGNCGIFLYWHGRLIEAYKRVGDMIHAPDIGRGVIGVIDVTDIMKLGDGVAVLNNKQGFQDCEEYAVLDTWLGEVANQYWEDNYDTLQVETKEENAQYIPDHDWVQCNKCLKWRMLHAKFATMDLPDEWFCYMPPFRGTCQIPQEETETGIVTLGTSRTNRNSVTAFVQVKSEVDAWNTSGDSMSSETGLDDSKVHAWKDCPVQRKPKRTFSGQEPKFSTPDARKRRHE